MLLRVVNGAKPEKIYGGKRKEKENEKSFKMLDFSVTWDGNRSVQDIFG